jgi:beta-lactamase regulating signal transducer with metallopeptidase domain
MSDFLQMLWTQAWQIAVLAIMVACCTRTIAKNRPHLAHAMWLLVLIKCVTPPMWGHSLGVFSRLQALAVSVEKTSVSTPEHVNTVEVESALSLSHSNAPVSGSLIESEITGHQGTHAFVQTDDSTSPNLTVVPSPEVSDWMTAEPNHPSRDLWPGPLFFCLVVGAVATLSVMIACCLQCLRSIHRHRTTEFDDLLNERLQMLSKKLRLRRVPRIIVSDVLFGPAVLGVLRHTIVLPRCLLQTSRSFLPERTLAEGEPARRALENAGMPEDAECTQVAASREVQPGRQDLPKPLPGRPDLQYLDPILAHELLHIRRGDLRTGLLQAIVQSLWWFHPAVWFCNRWLSREAERCCDEQVIAELGCSPAQYARSLLSVIESKHVLQPIPVFPGMKPVEITSQRMERIMSLKTGLKKQTPLWCWLAVTGLAIVVLPGAIAKPQSDESVVEAQPKEMALPQETKAADVAEVEVSTKTYLVGDLVERLAKEQNLSLDQARESLLQIFQSSVVPVHRHDVQGAPAPPVPPQQPSPPVDLSPQVIPMTGAISSSATAITVLSSYAIDGDRIVVVQSAAGHATLQQYIDAVRQYGFTTFQVTARYIIGPPEEINSLMEALQQEKPFPKAAEGKAVPKSSQSEKLSPQAAATLCVGTTGIVSFEESRKIEELARSKADCLSIQCPKVSAINGQVATIYVGEIKPFIVGFKENDEPMIRTVVEGLTLRVTPTVVDEGLFQLKSVACLEGTSEQRLMTTTGRVTETPKMFTLPAITEKRVQTTVELQENQAFLQSGLITIEEGKSQAFLTVLEARLIVPEVAGEPVEMEDKGETLRASGGNPCKSAAELKSLIRLHEDFMVSPEVLLASDTVVAIVADEKISLADVELLRGALQQMNRPPVVPQDMQQIVLRSVVERQLPKYLYDRLVLHEFESVVPAERKIAIRDRVETAFTELLQKLQIEEKAKDADDLSRRLAAGGLSVESFREGFIRRAMVDDYVQSLPAEVPLRDRAGIESHCRQLMFEARLRQKISLSENGTSLASVLNDLDEKYRVPISRNAIFQGDRKLTVTEQFVDQPLLEVIKKIVVPHGFQVYVGQEEVTIAAQTLEKSASVAKSYEQLIVLTYNVADLVVPVGGSDAKMDFSPLVELIKTSIEPESWETERGTISPHLETISLVIRQTQDAHDAIATLLSQLRKSYDSVKISCRMMKLSNDSQLKGLEERCSLHALDGGQRWALLTKSRSEELQKFLTDEKVDLLSCPVIVTISGQPALVEMGGDSESAVNGFRLSANPHLIADSNVIRLNHSVQIGEMKPDSKVTSHESLVGSGQTLVLLIEQPGKADVTPDRYAVLLTPEHLKEEKVEATEKVGTTQSEAALKP